MYLIIGAFELLAKKIRSSLQKVFRSKKCSEKFRNIHGKTPVPETLCQ